MPRSTIAAGNYGQWEQLAQARDARSVGAIFNALQEQRARQNQQLQAQQLASNINYRNAQLGQQQQKMNALREQRARQNVLTRRSNLAELRREREQTKYERGMEEAKFGFKQKKFKQEFEQEGQRQEDLNERERLRIISQGQQRGADPNTIRRYADMLRAGDVNTVDNLIKQYNASPLEISMALTRAESDALETNPIRGIAEQMRDIMGQQEDIKEEIRNTSDKRRRQELTNELKQGAIRLENIEDSSGLNASQTVVNGKIFGLPPSYDSTGQRNRLNALTSGGNQTSVNSMFRSTLSNQRAQEQMYNAPIGPRNAPIGPGLNNVTNVQQTQESLPHSVLQQPSTRQINPVFNASTNNQQAQIQRARPAQARPQQTNNLAGYRDTSKYDIHKGVISDQAQGTKGLQRLNLITRNALEETKKLPPEQGIWMQRLIEEEYKKRLNNLQ